MKGQITNDEPMKRRFTFTCSKCRSFVVRDDRVPPTCCGHPMKRDLKADAPKPLYHPTKGSG